MHSKREIFVMPQSEKKHKRNTKRSKFYCDHSKLSSISRIFLKLTLIILNHYKS